MSPRTALALAVTALLTAPAAAEDPIEVACLDAVGKLGAMVAEVDPGLDESARVAAHFATATDATLAAVGKLPAVGSLKVDDASRCTEKGFAVLRELPNLQVLVLGKCPVTDKGADEIGDMKTIRELFLGQARITDAGLAALKPLRGLTSLDVSDTRVTDAGLKHLTGFAALATLNLAGTKATDRGVLALKDLAALKTLMLHRTAVTAAGVRKLEAERPTLTVRY